MLVRRMPRLFRRATILAGLCGLVILVSACGSQEPGAQAGAAAGESAGPADSADASPSPGHDLFVSKGCAACHGQNGEGTSIAPGLPGHNVEMVIRQVRNPRFQMPVFSTAQISGEELDLIAGYISGL